VEALAYLLPLAAFVVVYQVLRRRAAVDGKAPPVQWGWLAAIFGCAAAAVLLGLLL
jgi:hypothetical protein